MRNMSLHTEGKMCRHWHGESLARYNLEKDEKYPSRP